MSLVLLQSLIKESQFHVRWAWLFMIQGSYSHSSLAGTLGVLRHVLVSRKNYPLLARWCALERLSMTIERCVCLFHQAGASLAVTLSRKQG